MLTIRVTVMVKMAQVTYVAVHVPSYNFMTTRRCSLMHCHIYHIVFGSVQINGSMLRSTVRPYLFDFLIHEYSSQKK